MANYAVWNVRLRHESLATPRKGKYLTKRQRERIGIQEALERKGAAPGEQSAEAESAS